MTCISTSLVVIISPSGANFYGDMRKIGTARFSIAKTHIEIAKIHEGIPLPNGANSTFINLSFFL